MRNIKTSIKIIETAVCFVMGVSEAALRIKTRKTNIKTARHLIYYLHQCEFDVIDCSSQEQLSARYGQNHEIVVHAKKSIKQALEEVNGIIVDPYIKGKVKKSKELVQIYTTSAIVKDGTNYKEQMRNAYLPLKELLEFHGISLSINEMNDIIIASDIASIKIQDVLKKTMISK